METNIKPRGDWMRGSVGLSVHWTSQSRQQDGSCRPYAEAVRDFDVPRFAEQVKQAGAEHIIFTLTHGEQYLACPCAPLEAVLPGRTTQRDLLGELIEAMQGAGVRFIAYYNHSCNGDDDVPWKTACGYAKGGSESLNRFARHTLDIVEWLSERYGRGISGWWFDSAYSVDPRGPHNTISCNLGDWQFPWQALADAARSGNKDAAVSVNAGIGERFLYTPDQDYYAGESLTPDESFAGEADPAMTDHRWLCADSPRWVFLPEQGKGYAALRFSDAELAEFVRSNREAGRMTTFNMEIDQTGRIHPEALAQLSRVR